jgi:hypothetical protein
MSLLSIWTKSSADVLGMDIKQIVTIAGDGKLTDDSVCSKEFRTFLSQVVTEKLEEYADYCLKNKFDRNGCVLQDIVNELGRRLDYNVSNGLYQGKPGLIGNDGLWRAPEANDILVEVKTTTDFRVPLQKIAKYRDDLQETAKAANNNFPSTSMLLVVGRGDTTELEAQIRGSRYAWDMRLISVDALIRLVRLKENTEEAVTGTKIRSVLIPMEYTRLDALIDVMSTAAHDVESVMESVTQPPPEDTEEESGWEFTDPALLDEKRQSILASFSILRQTKLIRKSKALYWSADHHVRVICTVSKLHHRGASRYWYAYHPQWDEFLGDGAQSYFVLGCMDLEVAFALPLDIIRKRLKELNTTPNNGKPYWHIKIIETHQKRYALQMPKTHKHLDLKEYAFKIN